MAELVLTWEAANWLEAAEEAFNVGKQLGHIQVHQFLLSLQGQVAASGRADTFADGVNDVVPAVSRQYGAMLDSDPRKATRVDVDTSFDRGPVMALYEGLIQAGAWPGVVEAALDVKREVVEACDSYDSEVEDWEGQRPEPDDPEDPDGEVEDWEADQPDPGYRDGHLYVMQAVQARFGIADGELEE